MVSVKNGLLPVLGISDNLSLKARTSVVLLRIRGTEISVSICGYLIKKPYHLVFLADEFLFLSFRYAFSVFSLH